MTGRYWHTLILGPILAAPGLGLLYTVDAHTSSAKLIGYQILAGAGLGAYFQNLLLAVQAEFADKVAYMPNVSSLPRSYRHISDAYGGCRFPDILSAHRCSSRNWYHQHCEFLPGSVLHRQPH